MLVSCLPAGSLKPGREGDALWCVHKEAEVHTTSQGTLRVQRVGTWEGFTVSPNLGDQMGPCQNSRVLGSGEPLLLSPTTYTPTLS